MKTRKEFNEFSRASNLVEFGELVIIFTIIIP